MVQTMLPNIIPPSYKGATIRYFYYVKSTFCGQWLILENGHSHRESVKDLPVLEARIPLQVWVAQTTSGMMEGDQSNGEFFFKFHLLQSVRANDIYDGIEEGYESSRDEISSVSSYSPMKEHGQRTLGSSLSLPSSNARSSTKDIPYLERERTSLSINAPLPRLSVAEVLHDSSVDDETGVSSSPGSEVVEPVASGGFIRGRSYSIRLDDQVLLRFSPKNSDSTYFFSDMIGGTLTFFHEAGARRCLEVSITLENVSQQSVHPSRRNSPTITKVQIDHYEVVADLIQTGFRFSIPMDGPMSFSTPHVSVQWSLRFEFFTTPKNVDWTRYEHPLLIEGRDSSDWVLPITVRAPPPGTSAAHTRNEKTLSLEPLWVQN